MSDDQPNFVPGTLTSYKISKERVSSKASSYAAGGFARVYHAILATEGGMSVPVALKELRNPIANPSEEKVI